MKQIKGIGESLAPSAMSQSIMFVKKCLILIKLSDQGTRQSVSIFSQVMVVLYLCVVQVLLVVVIYMYKFHYYYNY